MGTESYYKSEPNFNKFKGLSTRPVKRQKGKPIGAV